MYHCEICGKKADIHHVVHKSQGGLNFNLNYKYLCSYHHRGKNGPHKNIELDLKFKLELQFKLQKILIKNFYNLEELSSILCLNKNLIKKAMQKFKVFKEGFKREDIIYMLMGNNLYSIEHLEDLLLEKNII